MQEAAFVQLAELSEHRPIHREGQDVGGSCSLIAMSVAPTMAMGIFVAEVPKQGRHLPAAGGQRDLSPDGPRATRRATRHR